ncbi:MAG: hypothetical protein EAZ08_06705 [Cytophagales bacterium]|nr:MAG: hypothetical protein EAZ08_06705 [Cytophagales bacterium]
MLFIYFITFAIDDFCHCFPLHKNLDLPKMWERMGEFVLESREVRCLLCKESNSENFQVGICDFCFDELERKNTIKRDNKKMRYKEIDFFASPLAKSELQTFLMIWLSYLSHKGTIKVWNGILPLPNIQKTPLEIFENYARLHFCDYKEIYEVICCKINTE